MKTLALKTPLKAIVALGVGLLISSNINAGTIVKESTTTRYEIQIDCFHNGVKDSDTDDQITVKFLGPNGENLGVDKHEPSCNGVVDADYLSKPITSSSIELAKVRIETSGNDGFWMDEVALVKDSKHFKRTRDCFQGTCNDSDKTTTTEKDVQSWGVDGGKGYCLSTDPNDASGGFRQYTDRCNNWVDFHIDGRATSPVDRRKAEASADWQMCGTAKCISCSKKNCEGQNYSSLDRDKDKGDLKSCPSGYKNVFYKKYPQTWPAADVYLNICSKPKVTAVQKCFDLVQGKVAWNKAGNKKWSPGNVKNLCAGSHDPAKTIACFKKGIASHDQWSKAIAECSGR